MQLFSTKHELAFSPNLKKLQLGSSFTWWKTSNWMRGVESVSETGWVGNGSVRFISGVREIIPTDQQG